MHLETRKPEITNCFLDFLAGPARAADALYILGDLFEVWIGDDAAGKEEIRVAEGLRRLAATGVDVCFMAGNRDFLLGDDYCREAGMRRIEEPWTVELYGVPTLLLHGDVLCTDDTVYQRYRARTRDPAWQRRVLSRPRGYRRALARFARLASRLRTRRASAAITDVNADAVAHAFRAHRVDRMIHGHTHKPGIHRHAVDGRGCERVVLGDWCEQGSVLRVSSGGVELERLPLSEALAERDA